MSKEKGNTEAYIATVEFHNEVTDAPDVIDYVIFATSFKKAEKGIKKEVGVSLIKIHVISIMDVVPVF